MLSHLWRLSKPKPIRRSSYRPRLERLEDRLAPAIHTWDGLGNTNNCSEAANWNDNNVPVAGDTIIFDGTSAKNATEDLQFTGTINTVHVTPAYQGLLTLARNLTVSTLMDLEGSQITEVSNLTIATGGSFTWSAGTLTGPGMTTINAAATLTTSGAALKILNTGSLSNAGLVTLNAGIQIANGGSITNTTSGTIDLRADVSLTQGLGNVGSVTNQGIFQKSAGTGTSVMAVTFSNSGSVLGQTGTLLFTGSLSQTVNNPPTNATINVSSGANVLAQAVTISNGSIQGAGTFTVNAITNNRGTLDWTNGTLTGGGTLAIGTNGVLSIIGSFTADGYTLSNAGETDWLAGDIHLKNAAKINNQPTGLFRIQSNQVLWDDGGAPKITNQGVFRKENLPGVATTMIFTAFDNMSAPNTLVETQGGLLQFFGAGTHTAAFQADAGTTIEFDLAQQTVNAGATFTGTGLFRVTNNGIFSVSQGGVTIPNLTLSTAGIGGFFAPGVLSGAGSLSVLTQFNWYGGSIRNLGTLANFGQMSIFALTPTQALERSILKNYGTITWTGNADFTMSNAAIIDNLGTFDAQNDQTIKDGGGLIAPAFQNDDDGHARGTFKKSAGNGVTTVAVSSLNLGNLQLQGREIAFSAGLTQNFTGTTTLAGGNLQVTGGFQVGAGVVSGPGTITGDVTNSGELNLGTTVGILTITGNYTQTAAGTLNLKIGGVNAGTQYDQVQILGNTSLAGKLKVTLINGFAPARGNSFNLVHSTKTLSGAFSSTDLPPLGGGRNWILRYVYATNDFFLDVA